MVQGRLIFRAASIAAIALTGVLASGAHASSYCNPEESECTPTPSPTPSAPLLPTQAISSSGTYFIELGTIQNDRVQQGYIQDGMTTYFGGGPFRPIGGDGSLTVSGLSTSITLAPVVSPLASASAFASATPAQDPNFPGFGLVARGSISVGYLVVLHAQDQAAADALKPLLSTSGAIATISGLYSLGGTDSFWSSVVARTGVNELDPSLGETFYKACSLIGYNGTPDGCGAGSYDLPLNFVPGSTYQNGSSLDFISSIGLDASANAGPVNLGYYIGTAFATIDPTIMLAAGIDGSKYSLSVGVAPTPVSTSAVPEPASWALLLFGFGVTGGALRWGKARSARVVAAG